ncbi:MAG: DNA polymerase Y family protein [Myxococcota bacterium]|nr:DNA polymerase Y family protein [Myxococcota bacterium]
MRVACCRVPDLPLAAELRAHPELAGRPVAVASGAGPRAELVAVSPEAAARGVRRLVTVAHARSICAELCVRVASPALERAAREALLDAALSVSPRAALAPPTSGSFAAEGCVFVDARGVDALFHGEPGFATALGEHARRLGLSAAVAVAGSQDVARLVARRLAPDEVQVIAPGRERAFLAQLPLDLLDPDDALAESLTRFGVRSVRDLLGLPRRALGTRLGPRVMELVALARGDSRDPPLPAPEPSRLVEATDLEFPVERLEPLGFVLQGLLSRLLARLEARRLACGELGLRLDLEGGGRDARRVGLAAPTRELRVLMRLLLSALESRPPPAAVLGAALETEGRLLPAGQLDLFRPAGPAPAELGRTLAELQALCGEDRIGSPRPTNDHRPHLFEMQPFEPSPRDEAPAPRPLTLATRALRPPVAVEVRIRGTRPCWLRSAVANGEVLNLAGPWRTTGGWWSPERRFAYDYYDVQTSDGTLARLRFDHIHRAWHIDAVYD